MGAVTAGTRSLVWLVAAATAVFVACSLVGPGGLRTSWHAADVSYYGQLGQRLSDGEFPYRTLYVEYPPGALPVFLAPSVSQADYVVLFKLLMTACGVAALAATAAAAASVERRTGRVALSLVPLATAPVLLGSVFLNRFDPWPMLLTAVGLAALLRSRPVLGAAGLAGAVVTKIFAAAALPVVAVQIVRAWGRTALRNATLVFLAICAVVVLPFALLGPGGLAFSFYIQLTRHLELESLGASILLAADRLGLYHAHIVDGEPGSRDLAGAFATAVGALSTVAAVVALLGAAYLFAKGPASRRRLAAGVAAALAGYVAFGKVLSPQYVVWLLPVVPVVAGRVGYAATALLLTALGLTHLEFSHWNSINRVGPAIWLVVARDLVLVAVYAVLVLELRRTASPRPDGVAFGEWPGHPTQPDFAPTPPPASVHRSA
jgi:hypothetical protein